MNGVIQILGRMTTLGANESTPGGTGRGIGFSIARALWRVTLGPVYRLLFRAHFDTIEGRLEEVSARLAAYDASLRNQSATISDYGTELRNHVHGLNVRVDDLAGRVAALDEQVRTVLAGQFEQEAIARRLAALEDRIGPNGHNTVSGAP